MKEIIETIYNNVIGDVLQGFDEAEQEEIKNAYKNYLNAYYDKPFNQNISKEKMQKTFIENEQIKWQNRSKDYKQRALLKDEMLEKLGYLSNLGLKYAMLRLRGEIEEINITEQQVLEYIKMMEEYERNVKSFNKEIASIYLSEGILDFQYALGLSDNRSLRLG